MFGFCLHCGAETDERGGLCLTCDKEERELYEQVERLPMIVEPRRFSRAAMRERLGISGDEDV